MAWADLSPERGSVMSAASEGTMQDSASAERIRELEARCARLEKELDEALHSRNDFLATVAHELRGPISAMVLQVESLRSTMSRHLPEAPSQVTGKLDKLRLQMRRFVRRSTTLLDVSWIVSGQLTLHTERVDLSSIIQAVVEDFTPEATFASIPVTLQVQPGVEGEWDATACEQIVTNLLSNAIKYGDAKPIEVRLEADDHRARLVVRDQGIGISPADIARIFERFERAVTERRVAGFGVGLWVVRRLVESQGGGITVSSQPGQGSVFEVTLPRQSPKGT